MNAKEKAKSLVTNFGKEVALKVIEELLKRDKQWVEKLSTEFPNEWELSDFKKSKLIFDEVKNEVEKL